MIREISYSTLNAINKKTQVTGQLILNSNCGTTALDKLIWKVVGTVPVYRLFLYSSIWNWTFPLKAECPARRYFKTILKIIKKLFHQKNI